jgi:hypothetical protein
VFKAGSHAEVQVLYLGFGVTNFCLTPGGVGTCHGKVVEMVLSSPRDGGVTRAGLVRPKELCATRYHTMASTVLSCAQSPRMLLLPLKTERHVSDKDSGDWDDQNT